MDPLIPEPQQEEQAEKLVTYGVWQRRRKKARKVKLEKLEADAALWVTVWAVWIRERWKRTTVRVVLA